MESADGNLQALIEEFYDVWFRFHPDAALRAGIPGYAGKLPAVDDNEVGALGSWLESTVVGLEEIDFHSLDAAGQLDTELLFGACRDEYQAILERDWRHRDPLAFMPLETICRLVQNADTDGYAAVESCLKATPPFLLQARSRLAEFPNLVPHIWIDAALKVGAAGTVFLKQLAVSGDTPGSVQTLCDEVVHALTDYLGFLEQHIAPVAEGAAACGWQRFQEQLRLRHHMSDKLGDHLEMARQVYQETLAELGGLAFEQCGSVDPRVWLERLHNGSRLQGGERLQYLRRRSNEIHYILSQSGLFRLPDAAGLKIRLMPEGYPFDCAPLYRPPADGVSGSQGVLYLEQKPLGAAVDTAEWLTAWCIRNAWPGLHLQAAEAGASSVAGSLVRRLNRSSSQQLGWALYAEQLMRDSGLFSAPEQALHCLLERLRRSLMAVLDIELHVHGMAVSGALLQLQTLPGYGAEGAERDLQLLTRYPTQHLAGVVNWKLLDALRQWQSNSGEVDAAEFHARLLAQGSVATPLVIQRVFGQQAWNWVEARVYNQ